MQAEWPIHLVCDCGTSRGIEYLILRVRDLLDVFEAPYVRVSVSCRRCRHEQELFQSYPLEMSWSVTEQLRLLEETLEKETGLPVVVEPPDDPLAGVREPRRPAPGEGWIGVRLTPPSSP